MRSKLALLILLFLVVTQADAVTELPPNWPWRGISLGFNEATPNDIKRYKQALNINVVRLQIKARQYAKANSVSGDVALDKGMQWADDMLDECARLGVTAVVNISQFPLNPDLADQTTADFWGNSNSREGVIDVTRRLMEHFRTRGAELAAYDIMSEPVVVRGKESVTPPEWEGLLAQIANVAERLDKERWMLVSPGPWGGPEGYFVFNPPKRQRLIWGVHMYMPHRFSHQGIREIEFGAGYPGRIGFKYWDKNSLKDALNPVKKFQDKQGGIVWVGEFSAVRWADGGEQYIRDLTSIFDEYGWGWAYFSGTGWHGWNPDYNQNYPGKDSAGKWKQDHIGGSSVRWKTLRDIFRADKGRWPNE